MKPSIANGHGHLLAQQLALQMGIAVVFTIRWWVFGYITTSCPPKGAFKPCHRILMQAIFEVVDVNGLDNVHRIDQHKTIDDATHARSFNLMGQADDRSAFIRSNGVLRRTWRQYRSQACHALA